MRARRSSPAEEGETGRFERTNAPEFGDGPTELPPPWSTPPDPEFPTGMIPLLEPADLSVPREPGVEPSDSSLRTVRFSRNEMRDMVAARMKSGRLEKPEPAAAQKPVAAAAQKPVAAAAQKPVAAAAVKPAAGAAVKPVATATAAVLPLAPPAPPRADDATRSPALEQLLASGWQPRHTAIAVALAVAYVLGVLTGILALR